MAWNKAIVVCTVALVLVGATAQQTVPITCPNSSPCQTNLPAGYTPTLADCRRALTAFGGDTQKDQFCGNVGGNQGCVTTSSDKANSLKTDFQTACYGCVIKAFAKFQGQAVSIADKCLLNARANNEAPYTTECACECINGVSSADQANQCSTQCVNCRDFGPGNTAAYSVGKCTCCIEHNVLNGFNNDVASKCKQDAQSFDVTNCPCYNDGCFPRSASVELDNGMRKTMDELRVGDRVKTVSRSGRETFEDVYFFGHESATSKVTYMSIQMVDNTTLKVSPIHYVPIVRIGKEVKWESAEHVRAEHVREGMHMFVQRDGGMHAALVNGVGVSVERGAYNPYTLGGYIVVDGVLASSHSAWLLDDAMDALGATAMVPSLYQALLAPMRWTYRMLGARAMTHVGPLVMNFGLAAAEMKAVSVLIKTIAVVAAKATMAAVPLAIAAAMLRRTLLSAASGVKKVA